MPGTSWGAWKRKWRPMPKQNVVGGRQGLGLRAAEPGHAEMNPHLTETLKAKEGERIQAKPISIFEIYPDVMQPRRAMPSDARLVWDGEPASISQALSQWWGMANQQLGQNIQLQEILRGGLNEDDLPSVGDDAPLAESFLKLIALASSIQQEGLTNPITVVRVRESYGLETGERRWLAYHMLRWVTEDAKWERIPARVVEQFNVWRQAAENNTRADLNAIGKARQFALLLMDLIGAAQFQPFEVFGFEREQDFYAQVADGDVHRIPRGKAEMLLGAMGLKHSKQLRDYRALLRLDPELWRQADDESWTEFKIRRIQEGDTAPTGTVSGDETEGVMHHAPYPAGDVTAPSASIPRENGVKSSPQARQMTIEEYQPLFSDAEVKRAVALTKLDSRARTYEPTLKARIRQEIAEHRAAMDRVERWLDE